MSNDTPDQGEGIKRCRFPAMTPEGGIEFVEVNVYNDRRWFVDEPPGENAILLDVSGDVAGACNVPYAIEHHRPTLIRVNGRWYLCLALALAEENDPTRPTGLALCKDLRVCPTEHVIRLHVAIGRTPPQELLDELDTGRVAPRANIAPDEDTTARIPASDSRPEGDRLRDHLPTALTAAMAVRDLARMCRNYPNALPNDEARQLHEQLLGWFELNYDFAGLLNLSEAYTRPPFGDAQTEEMMTGVVAALMLQHPDNQGSGDHSAAGVQARCKEIMHACQKACDPQVQAIVDRIMEVMMIDCRILEPSDDPTFRDPRRFLQMLRKYWELCKSIILFEMNAEMGFRPHPLLPLIVNLRERIGACCAALESEQQIPSVVENINTLLDTLLKGDVDDLGIAEEWATGQLQSVDTSLATLRLRLGSGAFPLTREEQLCLEHAEAAVSEHASRVRKHWTAVEHSVRKRAAEVVTQRPDTGARPDVQADVASSDSKSRTPKRSTSQFEARDKLIAELTRHHGYADGGCLNQDPIGNNKLAKAVGVSPSTASEFFRNKFEGHDKYRALCRDRRGLVAALRLLNDDFAPYHLLGDRTAAVAADQADVVDDA